MKIKQILSVVAEGREYDFPFLLIFLHFSSQPLFLLPFGAALRARRHSVILAPRGAGASTAMKAE